MTFKEVDEKINHYEIELKKCVDEIAQTELFLENDNDEVKNLAKAHKLKVEFFCFVTTSYIDWLCVYRNLQRSKSERENYYNIKIAYLIAYETINTYYKFKGEIYKTVKKDYEQFFHTFFDMLNRELAEFKYEFDYDKIMPKIRNKSVAHYDRNFLEYYSNFSLIEEYSHKDIIRSFLYFLNPLHYFTYALMNDEIDKFLYLNSWMS